jgi:hypothetical protein
VLPGLGHQREQGCSEGRPGGLARDFRDDLVGLAVERLNDLKSDELLDCHLEPVGVALDGVDRPRGWVAELAQGDEEVGIAAGQDPLEQLSGGCGGDGFGLDDSVRVTVADHLQVEVVGRSSAGEHRVQCAP